MERIKCYEEIKDKDAYQEIFMKGIKQLIKIQESGFELNIINLETRELQFTTSIYNADNESLCFKCAKEINLMLTQEIKKEHWLMNEKSLQFIELFDIIIKLSQFH